MGWGSSEQPSDGCWAGTPVFGTAQPSGPYASATSPSDPHHGGQHHPSWFHPWILEGSDSLYPLAAGGSGGSPRADYSPGRRALSPMGSPGFATAEQDEHGRFVCRFPKCDAKPEDRIFTRKSDWRRHSDKHTRPYRCTYPACKNLAGFGWVGGLNRHLEELHNSKAQHKCPHTKCKRHANGFSRPANLKNHMRKVHGIGGGGSSRRGSGGGERSSAAPSEAAETSCGEVDSPPPLRRTKSARRTGRTEEELVRAIANAERAVARADEGMRGARQTQLDCLAHLEALKAELEDGRSNSSASVSDLFSYPPSHHNGGGGGGYFQTSPPLPPVARCNGTGVAASPLLCRSSASPPTPPAEPVVFYPAAWPNH